MFALLAWQSAFVWADIPTHCTLADLVGVWKFTIVVDPVEDTCGYPLPQTMKHNLHQLTLLQTVNHHKPHGNQLSLEDPVIPLIKPDVSHVLGFDVTLSAVDYPSGQGFRIESTTTTSSSLLSGFWTPVFDQGLMLKNFRLVDDKTEISYRRALAYSAFECLDPTGVLCENARDTSNDVNGNPPGQFKSQCGSTLVGWAVTEEGETHCFRGERIKSIPLEHPRCPAAVNSKQSAYKNPEMYEDLAVTWMKRNYPVQDQQNCGSCYVHASLFALRASLLKSRIIDMGTATVLQELDELGLDIVRASGLPSESDILVGNESFANQNCQGGHPMFLGLALMIKQLPVSFDFLTGRYLPDCPADTDLMERHLREKGPLVVAVDVPSMNALLPVEGNSESVKVSEIPFQGANEKQDMQVRVLTKLQHKSQAKDTHYEFANHAMVIVGYGKGTTNTGAEVPYWLLRNSWGPVWGDHGYVRILKGKNLGGIESQVMSLTFDFHASLSIPDHHSASADKLDDLDSSPIM